MTRPSNMFDVKNFKQNLDKILALPALASNRGRYVIEIQKSRIKGEHCSMKRKLTMNEHTIQL